MVDRASRGWRGVQQTIPSIRVLAELRREPPRRIINEEPVSVGFYTRSGRDQLSIGDFPRVLLLRLNNSSTEVHTRSKIGPG